MESAKRSRVAQIRPEYVRSKEIYEKKRKKRKRGLVRRLAAFAILFTFIVAGMVTTLSHQSSKINQKEAQKTQLAKKLDESVKKEKSLKHKITLLHNKDYIGELARKEFLLSKDGEVIFSSPGSDNH